MTILITGGCGQLGFELIKRLGEKHDIVAPARDKLDLANADAIVQCVRAVKPTLIINPGAYTAVDKAETEMDAAHAINARAPQILAEEANRLGIPIVHYSTDYVFDGSATEPYRESDPTAPLGVYGQTKLAGEQAVCAIAARHLVLRVSWLYASRRQNFMLTMLRLARERSELRVVGDQLGAPTWAGDVAALSVRALHASSAGFGFGIADGLYHAAADGVTSWHGFTERIIAATRARDTRQIVKKITAITTADYPTPARRPAYSKLSSAKLEAALGTTMSPWEAQLEACLAEMLFAD